MMRATLLLFSLLASWHYGQAQCFNDTKSYPLYQVGAELVSTLDSAGKEIVRIEYDLIFTSKETFRQLASNWEYTLVAFSDDGVKDLDIKLYEYDARLDRYVLKKKDNSNDKVAVLTWQPQETAKYKIEIIVYQFQAGYTSARYGLIVFHD